MLIPRYNYLIHIGHAVKVARLDTTHKALYPLPKPLYALARKKGAGIFQADVDIDTPALRQEIEACPKKKSYREHPLFQTSTFQP